MGPVRLIAVADQPGLHNVIVCTLCSCYPRMLLGLPPDWYKMRAYRSRVVREPRAVLKEFGTELPDDTEIRVHDSTADMRYLVVPEQPAGTEGLGRSGAGRSGDPRLHGRRDLAEGAPIEADRIKSKRFEP